MPKTASDGMSGDDFTSGRLPDLNLVRDVEERLVNAWPGLQTLLVGDWVLRFADGYSKRANSASPLRPNAVLTPAVEKAVRKLYGQSGLPEIIRITPLAHPDTERKLADAGFADDDPTFQMLGPLPAPGPPDPALALSSRPSAEWIAGAAADYGGDKSDPAKLGAILRLIRMPAIYAELREDGAVLARGMSVRERGFAGLFDIVVAPQARGKGHGRRLVEGLLRLAAREGADRAYLQVRISNQPAIRLYRSLGFEPFYTYRHRIRQSAAP
jgi:N-acetylglutamate synthase